MDKDLINYAFENIKQESILDTNINEINNIKKKVLNQLQLSPEKNSEYLNKLNKYRFVDEITDLNCGDFVRWIDLTTPTHININNGAFICDIEINHDGIHLKLKTFRNRYIQIRMDEVFLFQKLTNEELIILSALNYLEK